MASRRTRIKGIANIPQRRKTVNLSNADENPNNEVKLEETVKEEPNLNSTHDVKVEETVSSQAKTVLSGDENKPNSNGFIPDIKEHESEADSTTIKTDLFNKPTVLCGNGLSQTVTATPIEIPNNVNSLSNREPKQHKPLPPRRKFIKPIVSLNALNQKSRDSSEHVKTVEIEDKTNGIRTGKIVILNEVIAYPDQNHPVVIQDHQSLPSKGEDSLLKPPEVNNIRKPPASLLERDITRLGPSGPKIVVPDVEYPIPPPSPSKINRARIKAVPRLGQRHTSFSASESEDESRRNYRHRNDSVCSSASGLQDTNSIPDCPSLQKPREFNSVIQRKCRRTEQSRKLAEAKRDFHMKFGDKKPDRQKLTMIDLIFYNPGTNPMSNNKKRKFSVSESENQDEVQKEEEPVVDTPPNKTESDEENEIPAPQIKIGPSGEIVVDEQSLVIENKAVKKNREQIEKSQVVNGDNETGYGMYKRVKRSKDWSKEETLKFYKALNTIGTDFTMMCELFPRRTRRELKMKFKKEERVNRALVDKAIMQPRGFDFEDFKQEVELEEQELQAIEKQKEREKEMKKEAKKRKISTDKKEPTPKIDKPKKKKPFNILSVLDDNSDADESEVESVEDEETEEKFLQSLQKPTRSGRVPKSKHINHRVPPQCETKGDRPKPGSLIVMATTGENGQPVYKVCMVTGEYSRQQIGEDMTSLEKALECKENGLTNLFTLTASTLTEEASPVEENNVTIPADEPIENNITTPADIRESCTMEENHSS